MYSEKNNCADYQLLRNFGAKSLECGLHCSRAKSFNDIPLSYCLNSKGWDQYFNHPPNGILYGPNCRLCRLYMAQRCSEKWDKYCDYYAKRFNPNLANETLVYQQCSFPQVRHEPFNPLDPDSPFVAVPYGQPVCNNKMQHKFYN